MQADVAKEDFATQADLDLEFAVPATEVAVQAFESFVQEEDENDELEEQLQQEILALQSFASQQSQPTPDQSAKSRLNLESKLCSENRINLSAETMSNDAEALSMHEQMI